jgi:hypothetical protein
MKKFLVSALFLFAAIGAKAQDKEFTNFAKSQTLWEIRNIKSEAGNIFDVLRLDCLFAGTTFNNTTKKSGNSLITISYSDLSCIINVTKEWDLQKINKKVNFKIQNELNRIYTFTVTPKNGCLYIDGMNYDLLTNLFENNNSLKFIIEDKNVEYKFTYSGDRRVFKNKKEYMIKNSTKFNI